jgi:hypothetical protein
MFFYISTEDTLCDQVQNFQDSYRNYTVMLNLYRTVYNIKLSCIMYLNDQEEHLLEAVHVLVALFNELSEWWRMEPAADVALTPDLLHSVKTSAMYVCMCKKWA